VENLANLPVLTTLPTTLRVRNRSLTWCWPRNKISVSANSPHACTASTTDSQRWTRKTAPLRAKRKI